MRAGMFGRFLRKLLGTRPQRQSVQGWGIHPSQRGNAPDAAFSAPVDPQRIVGLWRRVDELRRQGHDSEAVPLAEELHDLVQTFRGGKDHGDVARTLHLRALLHQGTGDLERAKGLLQDALEMHRRLRGDDDQEASSVLADLASVCDEGREYRTATSRFTEALAALRRGCGEEDPRILEVLALRTRPLRRLEAKVAELGIQGRHEEALASAHEMQFMARLRWGEDSHEYAESLAVVAGAAGLMGWYDVSASHYRQALEVMQRAGAAEDMKTAKLHGKLGDAYAHTGDLTAAERHLREAIRILTGTGVNDAALADSLEALARLYLTMGRRKEVEPLLQRSIEIRSRTKDENQLAYAIGLNHVGLLYHVLGKQEETEKVLLQALEIGRRHPEKDDLTYVASLMALVQHYFAVRKLKELGSIWREAVDFINAHVADKHPAVLALLGGLNAHLLIDAGLYDKAESYLRQQRAFMASSGVAKGANLAQTLEHLADVCAATGREQEALTLLQEAATIDDGLIGEVFSISSERQRLAYVEFVRSRYERHLSLLLQQSRDDFSARRAALNLVLRRKGIGAEALAAQRDAVLGGGHPALKPKLQDLTALRMRIAREMLSTHPGGSVTQGESLAELTARREALEVELARAIPELNLERALRGVDAEAVARALPANAALVEIVRLNVFDSHAVPLREEKRWKPARYFAFVLRAVAPAALTIVDLGEAEVIDKQIAAFRGSITCTSVSGQARDVESVGGENAAAVGSVGSGLRAALFDPLLEALAGARRLFIAPDGDLTRLPFEVLPTDEGGELVESYRISYLSTGRDALRFGLSPSAAPSDAVIVADPDFDLCADPSASRSSPQADGHRQSRDLNRGNVSFTRLPGTRVEGQRIAGRMNVQPWLRGQALEAPLKARQSPRVLHLATHGFFLQDQELLVDQDRIRSGDSADPAPGGSPENPLLRSGLALAGANTWLRRGHVPQEAEDGLLTAEDVSGLDLRGTELVVLSACETGLGEVRVGEGVFGLRRAFVLAGAKTLVMSLWKVPDEETQELMEDFYNRLLSGAECVDALRDAQLALKKKSGHPRSWGAFICQGDPGPLRRQPMNDDATAPAG